MSKKIAVIGGGSWGTGLAFLMADQGFEMEKEVLKRMGKTEEEIEEQLGTKTVVNETGQLLEIPVVDRNEMPHPPVDEQPPT